MVSTTAHPIWLKKLISCVEGSRQIKTLEVMLSTFARLNTLVFLGEGLGRSEKFQLEYWLSLLSHEHWVHASVKQAYSEGPFDCWNLAPHSEAFRLVSLSRYHDTRVLTGIAMLQSWCTAETWIEDVSINLWLPKSSNGLTDRHKKNMTAYRISLYVIFWSAGWLQAQSHAVQPDITRFLLESNPDGWDTERYTNEIKSVLYPVLLPPSVVRTMPSPIGRRSQESAKESATRLWLKHCKTSPFTRSLRNHFEANWEQCQTPPASSITFHSWIASWKNHSAQTHLNPVSAISSFTNHSKSRSELTIMHSELSPPSPTYFHVLRRFHRPQGGVDRRPTTANVEWSPQLSQPVRVRWLSICEDGQG